MESCELDFVVFMQWTYQEFIYNDIQSVLGKSQGESIMVFDTTGITDTIGKCEKARVVLSCKLTQVCVLHIWS